MSVPWQSLSFPHALVYLTLIKIERIRISIELYFIINTGRVALYIINFFMKKMYEIIFILNVMLYLTL